MCLHPSCAQPVPRAAQNNPKPCCCSAHRGSRLRVIGRPPSPTSNSAFCFGARRPVGLGQDKKMIRHATKHERSTLLGRPRWAEAARARAVCLSPSAPWPCPKVATRRRPATPNGMDQMDARIGPRRSPPCTAAPMPAKARASTNYSTTCSPGTGRRSRPAAGSPAWAK